MCHSTCTGWRRPLARSPGPSLLNGGNWHELTVLGVLRLRLDIVDKQTTRSGYRESRFDPYRRFATRPRCSAADTECRRVGGPQMLSTMTISNSPAPPFLRCAAAARYSGDS